MKKILSLAVFVAGLTGMTYAQSIDTTKKEVRQERRHGRMHIKKQGMMNKTPEEIAQAKTDRMDKQLKFSEAQKKEVYAFHLNKAQAWKEEAAARKEERMARIQDMKADREAFEKMLTPEQKEIYKNKMADRRKEHMNQPKREMRKGGKGSFKPVEASTDVAGKA